MREDINTLEENSQDKLTKENIDTLTWALNFMKSYEKKMESKLLAQKRRWMWLNARD